ncbi:MULTISPECIES: helix-turn-helix domain-containing protein [Serratia]|uniref:Putative DNA-binding transcriptional regulator n=1 Tax=Serratia quinivorans TaxID=137545 RepID=A0A380D9C0_9GAMM|nr:MULTISPECIES: helix-turn-helix domain-containing protein [Serratia]RYM56833.1 Crp/Fnr family transcriptional regulator [Serratia proteamaculans]CAI2031460.1 putative DNA-binding transcriptional regulator [Serratia quinivorans]SUJ86280.1 putative DNA-binding transcriptional regulator [Serratia quinivorans]
MNVIPPKRPDSAIDLLLESLIPVAEKITLPPRKLVVWKQSSEANLYLFLNGEISILRSSDNLVLAKICDPHIFGIAEIFQSQRSHSLRPETKSTILKIKAEKAKEIFDEQNLWRSTTELLAYHTAYLGYRDGIVLQQYTYSVVRDHLIEMMTLPEESRRQITILRYIQERTYLSRSSILNILSTLKKAGHIVYARGGILKEIKSIPDRC